MEKATFLLRAEWAVSTCGSSGVQAQSCECNAQGKELEGWIEVVGGTQ